MNPVNSNIPLSIQTPTFLNPAQLAQQRLTLQQLANTTQLQKQAQQENALKIQESQQAVDDQKATSAAYLENAEGIKAGTAKLEDWPTLAAQKGASAKAIEAINNMIITGKKNLADTDELTLKNQQSKLNMVGSTAQGLLALPDDQLVT